MTSDPKGLGAMFDAHTDAEFKTRDIEATMATMSGAPHVTHVPTMTSGSGREAVRRFYETWFIGHWPKDTLVTLISRTVGDSQVVDEVMISFTHDCAIPALLPGVKPTGRKVTIPFVVVVGFKDGKIEGFAGAPAVPLRSGVRPPSLSHGRVSDAIHGDRALPSRQGARRIAQLP